MIQNCNCPKNDAECSTCGTIHCPEGDSLHYHHDGCPACATTEDALERLEALIVQAQQAPDPMVVAPMADVVEVVAVARDMRLRWRYFTAPLLATAQRIPPELCLHPARDCATAQDGDGCWACELRRALERLTYFSDPDAWDAKELARISRGKP